MNKNIDILDILEFDKGIVQLNNPPVLTILQYHLVKEIKEKKFDIDYIYFSGEYPSVYFKKVKKFDEETLTELGDIHKKIWNQGKVPFLYVESQTEIRIYNCYHAPINPKREDQNIEQIEIFSTNKDDAAKLKELAEVFGLVAIETGQFWDSKISNQFINKHRVNKALIENLKITREKLISLIGRGYEGIVHDLLIRSLFILYLEDTGATDNNLYGGFDSYFQVLDDCDAAYRLFEKLEISFNGNLCPVSETEKKNNIKRTSGMY